jgi:hypothetical protein
MLQKVKLGIVFLEEVKFDGFELQSCMSLEWSVLDYRSFLGGKWF